MPLHIYNTMTRKKELFRPQTPGEVRMYVCGPTVYDCIHIGNARPQIFFDVVRRYFEYSGWKVTYVVNFTDVDDKLIKKSEQTGIPVPELADHYIGKFFEDAEALGIRPADVHPRVMEHIGDIVQFVAQLIERGFAYERDGDVYFRTAKFEKYGQLSHQNIDELQFGIRVEVDERKEDERDFVLWKKAKPGEIKWDSPWGEGRPGWHIECSTMSRRYLGDTLDIHGGGLDLQFPHHECEAAQSEALTGKPLANYWMHNGYIHIRNEKMSKSLGNSVYVYELRQRYPAAAIRYFILSTHYRNPLNFSEEAMEQAVSATERIANCVGNLRHRLKNAESGSAADGPQRAAEGAAAPGKSGAEGDYLRKLKGIEETFRAKMDDDFNTPDAITAVFAWVTETNQLLNRAEVSVETLRAGLAAFEAMNGVLGLVLAERQEELLDEEIEKLIAERTEARKRKDWARADEIRDLLAARGILLEDTPQGVRWRRAERPSGDGHHGGK